MERYELSDPNGLFKGSAPLLIAHRGYTPIAPENSLVSFLEAARRGYWAIETDVHETLDGVLVCCHNFSLSKMYGVSMKIEEHTYRELSELYITAGNNADKYSRGELRLPLFDEYLDICKKSGCVPFIETKGDVVGRTLEAVERFDLIRHSVLSSSNFDHISEARKLNSEIFIHHIFSTPEQMEIIAGYGNGGLSYNYPILDEVPEGLIELTHKHGVRVCLRAGDTPESVERMLQMGLDYIPTNCTVPKDAANVRLL